MLLGEEMKRKPLDAVVDRTVQKIMTLPKEERDNVINNMAWDLLVRLLKSS